MKIRKSITRILVFLQEVYTEHNIVLEAFLMSLSCLHLLHVQISQPQIHQL